MKYIIIILLLLTSTCYANKELYDKRCMKCHGITGNGDGPSSDYLAVKPAKFTDPKIFVDKEGLDMTPDERMTLVIKQGGQAVKKSKLMQGFPDLSDEQVKSLLNYIKTFAKGK